MKSHTHTRGAVVSHSTDFISEYVLKVWDGELGYLLGPAMFAYEQERVSGFSFGSGDFQDAVQGAVPDRYLTPLIDLSFSPKHLYSWLVDSSS